MKETTKLTKKEQFFLDFECLKYGLRGNGRCKVIGVQMTFCGALRWFDQQILRVLNGSIFTISRNIGGAIAPSAPQSPGP